MHADDGVGGIGDLRLGAGKPDEQQSGDDRCEHRAGDDFRRRDDMTIQRGRRHHAVTDRGQGLDAEKEDVGERARRGIGDGAGAEPIEQRENHIDRQPAGQHHRYEAEPGQADCQMVRIAQVEARRADFRQAEFFAPDGDRLGLMVELLARHGGKPNHQGAAASRFAWPNFGRWAVVFEGAGPMSRIGNMAADRRLRADQAIINAPLRVPLRNDGGRSTNAYHPTVNECVTSSDGFPVGGMLPIHLE